MIPMGMVKPSWSMHMIAHELHLPEALTVLGRSNGYLVGHERHDAVH
jgi:hypothetical protein